MLLCKEALLLDIVIFWLGRECRGCFLKPPFYETNRRLSGFQPCRSVIRFYFDSADATVNKVELFGCSFREVDDPVFDIGPPIVDLYEDHFSVVEVGYPDDSSERKRTMGSGELFHVKRFAVCCCPSVESVGVIGCFSDCNHKPAAVVQRLCSCEF